ncbi:ran family small GTPase, partial [Naegleria gruberi]
SNYDELFKVIVIGDSSVGKTSLLNKMVSGTFTDSFMPTVGVDLKVRFLTIDGKNIKLQIWDTAGQERYRNLTKSYYRGSDGIILVYDITQEKTFNNLSIWLNEVKKNILGVNNGDALPIGADLNIFIIGNKTDLETARNVSTDKGKKFAESLQIDAMFEEISCKTTESIEETVLCRLARRILETRQREKNEER